MSLQAAPNTLGHLLLMQNAVAALPDMESVLSFICEGLAEIPGVASISHAPRAEPDGKGIRLPLGIAGSRHGELVLTIADPEAFAPYDIHIRNFCFVVSLIFEERSHRRLCELHRENLERSNHELEAYSYSVAHDLRPPLRTLSGVARILLEDEAGRLSPSGRQSLEQIIGEARQMNVLIENLLRLSRLKTDPLMRQQVPMTPLANAVAGETRAEYPNARWEIGVLPTAIGDPAMLRLVWINLIANALKYSSTVEQPRILIAGDEDTEETRYWVQDNGTGFDHAAAESMFGVFQCIHSPDFPGTGVALAIVKRAVDRHLGRVWAESSPGEGARFYFALPKPAAGG